MMELSTKGRYATRSMLELALRNGNAPVRLEDISRAQRLSQKYLSRLMAAMAAAGLVTSRRGQNGGYTLAKSPSDIRILDILLAVEGPVRPAPCLDDSSGCRESDVCAARHVWAKVRDGVTDVLSGITLEDLAESHRKNGRSVQSPASII
jgi:Rrf2 family transcriptional regulator, cysteine metabolism repressor